MRTSGNGDTVAFPHAGVRRKCKVYGKLILRKITEIVAAGCHILKLKCNKFHFRWGSATDPAGELTASGLKEPTSKGREGRKGGRKGQVRGKGEGVGEERRGKGKREWWKGRDGRGGEGKRTSDRSPSSKFVTTPLLESLDDTLFIAKLSRVRN